MDSGMDYAADYGGDFGSDYSDGWDSDYGYDEVGDFGGESGWDYGDDAGADYVPESYPAEWETSEPAFESTTVDPGAPEIGYEEIALDAGNTSGSITSVGPETSSDIASLVVEADTISEEEPFESTSLAFENTSNEFEMDSEADEAGAIEAVEYAEAEAGVIEAIAYAETEAGEFTSSLAPDTALEEELDSPSTVAGEEFSSAEVFDDATEETDAEVLFYAETDEGEIDGDAEAEFEADSTPIDQENDDQGSEVSADNYSTFDEHAGAEIDPGIGSFQESVNATGEKPYGDWGVNSSEYSRGDQPEDSVNAVGIVAEKTPGDFNEAEAGKESNIVDVSQDAVNLSTEDEADELSNAEADNETNEPTVEQNQQTILEESLVEQKPINYKYANDVYQFDPEDEPELSELYPNGVAFDSEGYPDFSPYAIKIVEIDMKGNQTSDPKQANIAAGLDEKPDGYTWHHHQDGKTMLLVPTDLHAGVHHTGGVSVLKHKNQ